MAQPRVRSPASVSMSNLGVDFTRTLVTCGLDDRLASVLRAYKLTTLKDLLNVDEEELSKVVHIEREEAASILSAVEQITHRTSLKQRIKVTSAQKIFESREILPHQPRRQGNELHRIHTNCSDLDAWLRGGISLGSLTELYGQAGTGKTQWGFQLCVNVQKPRALDGLQAEALFIDGENCFRPERLIQMANGALASWRSELTAEAKKRKEGLIDEMCQQALTVQSVLNHIHYLRIHSPQELRVAILDQLELFLSCHPNIRLVVVDGLSYQLRYSSGNSIDYKDRTDFLHLIAHTFRTLAHKNRCAFLITNQITSDLDSGKVIPALGQTWSKSCSTKIHIERTHSDIRLATVIKSKDRPTNAFRFRVTSDGITGVN